MILIKIGVAAFFIAALIFCGYQLNVNCCSNYYEDDEDE